MKQHLLIAVATLFGLSASAQDLSIATFNCEFLIHSKVHIKYGLEFRMSDEPDSIQTIWNAPGFRDSKFEEACEKVAEKVKELDADIIGLTEIGDEDDVEIFLEKLAVIGAGYDHVEVCNSSDPTGQHVVILSRFPITMIMEKFDGRALYFTEPDLDETDDTGISKGMHVSVNADGKVIDIFLLHLKSERGGHEADDQRIAQAEVARREIFPLLNDPTRLVVVMGDLNSEKRHETLLKLRGFYDIHPELMQTGDDYYFADFTTRWTYNYKGSKEQIDHILLSYSFDQLCKRNNPGNDRWGIKTSILETTNPLVSDHNGLKVDLFYR